MAIPLDGYKLTKVSATICSVDGTAWWWMIAESISCAGVDLSGSSPADQPAKTGPSLVTAWSTIACSAEALHVTSAMSMVASSSLREISLAAATRLVLFVLLGRSRLFRRVDLLHRL